MLNRTGMSRLIIAVMNPGHTFTSMKAIQTELNDAIISLIPKNCANPSVPFMTDGDELGGMTFSNDTVAFNQLYQTRR